jgi:iron complex transport system ATP-binding protein
LDIKDGKFSVIIGPNGCGKSTLLRGLCNLLPPSTGQVLLDGHNIARLPPRKLAKEVGLLPQSAQAPPGITVVDLVARGRYPHQGPFRQQSVEDERIVAMSMDAAGVSDLAHHEVETLSGGQRQRVWIALVLAQETPILLLDEPTTYLDIAHQLDLLSLLRKLNREGGRTIVAVLHDLNQACRYADHLVVMKDGEIITEGSPAALMTSALLQQVFGLDAVIINDPVSHTPLIVPR